MGVDKTRRNAGTHFSAAVAKNYPMLVRSVTAIWEHGVFATMVPDEGERLLAGETIAAISKDFFDELHQILAEPGAVTGKLEEAMVGGLSCGLLLGVWLAQMRLARLPEHGGRP